MATRKKPKKKSIAKTIRGAYKEKKPVQQGNSEYQVGYGKPPIHTRWPKGQSGNPKGPPKARTNLWPTLCRMMNMTPAELAKLLRNRKSLTVVEVIAVKLASQLQSGMPKSGIPLILKHMIERDEGRPLNTLRFAGDDDEVLSPEDCEEIRQAMRKPYEQAHQERIHADMPAKGLQTP